MARVLFFLCVIIPISVFSQLKTIKGRIDSDNYPVLIIKSTSDSLFIRSTFPDSTRVFVFNNIPLGEYFIESVGINNTTEKIKTNIIIDSSSEEIIDIGIVHYNSRETELNEVVITAQKPIYQSKIGKFIYNVENNTLAIGNNTLETLKHTPLVVVDPGDNITVQGRSPSIYINGRKSNLGGDQLISYLKSVPSEQISRIEVITVPSAKYEASGAGGVIDIIMKRSTKIGLNGNVNMSSQLYKRESISPSLNLNLNTEKARFFVSGSYNQNNHGYNIESNTVYKGDINDQIWKGNGSYSNPFNDNWNYNLSGGTEVFLNKTNTLYFETSYQQSKSSLRNTDSTVVFKEGNQLIDSLIHSRSVNSSKNKVFSSNLYHTLTIDATSGKLETGVGYFDYSANSESKYESTVLSSSNELLSEIDYLLKVPPSGRGWVAQSDFVGQHVGKLEYRTGVRYSHTKTDFEQAMEIQNAGGYYNEFQYRENIFAAYGDIEYLLNDKWAFKGGLRLENTDWKGKNNIIETKDNRNYLELFPTLFIQFKPNESNTFQLAYNRRISRPSFSQLNPTKRYNNPYSYFVGNPDLRPAITDGLQFSAFLMNRYHLSVDYSESNNGVYNIRQMDNTDNTLYTLPVNLTTDQQVGISIFLPVTFVKDWWNMNFSVREAFRKANNPYYGYISNRWQAETTLNITTSSKLTPNGKTQAEISYFYITPHYYGVQEVSEVNILSFAIAQKILKDNGTIKFSIDNILNWGDGTKSCMRSQSNTGSYYQHARDYNYGFKLAFSYRFETGLKRNSRNKSSLNNEQSRRVQY